MTTAEQLKNAENVLTQAIIGRGKLPDVHDITDVVTQFWPTLSGSLFNLVEADFENLIRLLEARFVTTMEKGVVLTDADIPHNENWHDDRKVEWKYWDDYNKYLIGNSWPPQVIQSLDSVTTTILGLLHDPLQDGEWERRGLVIGHVQSGKTANYLGLITKAADSGYKFIIVIAGIHNELRRQTQERIDEGFIGQNSVTRTPVGVGNIRSSRSTPVTVTTAESDFNRTVSRNVNMGLNALNNTFILVIKKNVSTLSSLYNWLRQLNTSPGFEKIADIPMLLIDDEADNASINTNRPELDPTRTNREIRRILNLFRKRCYVGYTATPFANIFINPDATNDLLGAELFPEHFIYSLDAPASYMGYEKIFLEEEGHNRYIRSIGDAAEWLPHGHKKDTPVYELPDSLNCAMRLFLLSRAIRNLRGQEDSHCSMLVNISRFVAVQREVRSYIDLYLSNLQKAIRYNYALKWEQAGRDPLMARIYTDFREEYGETKFEWAAVLKELNNAASSVKIALVNSRSDEKLLYSEYNRDKKPLTVIAIGGLSLSRGLTLEGLTISYIHRNTQMYDTLMQMGRWFGYRPDYEDLCRIFMSELSYEWYAYIAEATEELRQQVRRMRRERKKPIDFGLYVRAHPDTLTVTASNKMYHTDNRAFRISYDGGLIETFILPEKYEKNHENIQLFNHLFATLGNAHAPLQDESGSYFFRDISWETIQDLLLRFRFHDDLADRQDAVSRYIKAIADVYPLWDTGFISLRDSKPQDGFMVSTQRRTIGYINDSPRMPVSEPGWYTGNKRRFSGNSMFGIGLSVEQVAQAWAEAYDAGRKTPIYKDYTNARKRPLLLLHLLNLTDTEKNPLAVNVPAISISFPNSGVFTTIEYIVGPVWLKQLTTEEAESQEDEDDFDSEQPLD